MIIWAQVLFFIQLFMHMHGDSKLLSQVHECFVSCLSSSVQYSIMRMTATVMILVYLFTAKVYDC